jgi:uncharacterized membrane protein YhaH (DUF805 family)
MPCFSCRADRAEFWRLAALVLALLAVGALIVLTFYGMAG